jgi:hypothetical protein
MIEPDHTITTLTALRRAIKRARTVDVVVMLGNASPCVTISKREALALCDQLAAQWGEDAESIDSTGWAVTLDNGERVSIGGL